MFWALIEALIALTPYEFSLSSLLMYLYLGNNPRSLILVTSPSEVGKPKRALVFRAGANNNQAVVEFLPKDEVDLSNVVKLTQRGVKGCLGLISVENGRLKIHSSILI